MFVLACLTALVGVLPEPAVFRLSSLSLCEVAGNPAAIRPLPAGHVYRPGDTFGVQAEARNVPYQRVWFDCRYRLEWLVTVTDRDGREVIRNVHRDERISCGGPSEPFRYGFMRGVEGLKPGAYTLSVELKDLMSGRGVRREVVFSVAGAK